MARLTVEAPGGEVFEREVVHHPGAVVVVPILDDGPAGAPAVLLVRQYRAAVDRWLLELPAGKRDVSGEAPEQTARRELEEEVGMRAGRMEELVSFYNSPGFCDEHTYVYLARGLTPCDTSPHGVEEGLMAIEQLPLEAAAAMVRRGEIEDAKTIVGLCLARETLRQAG
ncbi:MAG: NUDIX hydrolase [Acidimicrobiales bacterium]